MITLFVLLVMAAPVLGNQDFEEVCPFEACWPKNTSIYTDKPAPKIKLLVWRHASDLEVTKVTPNLEHLYVFNCSSEFKIDVLPPMTKLNMINITNCPISELEQHVFENVINLEKLALAGNFIEKLSNETFHKLSNVKYLYLQHNLIKDLPEGVFHPLERLYQLNLNNNNISILSKDIFLMNSKLQVLSLRGNPLKILTLDFPIWTFLTIIKLDVSDCKELTDLRLSIRVSDLYLRNSGVERLAITGSVSEIHHENSKVTFAWINGTYFHRSFVQVLCDMPSLDYLVLWNCTKSSDYSYFEMDENGKKCNFPNLQSLHLMGNKLNYIPRRLPLFGPNLTTLDISHNKLEYDSLELLFDLDTPKEKEGNFPNIRFLAMGHNLLKKLPRMCPLFGPNLTILDLSHNLLESVSMESFDKAQNLESLYLHGNRLTSFDYLYVCDGLKNLKWVVLQDNFFNATFYGNMSKFLDDNNQRLIEMNKRILI